MHKICDRNHRTVHRQAYKIQLEWDVGGGGAFVVGFGIAGKIKINNT